MGTADDDPNGPGPPRAPSQFLLPWQFDRLWRGSEHRVPERTLALEVLRQAADDLRKYRGTRSPRGQVLYYDAYYWVAATNYRWPYSFVNICLLLDLSPLWARDLLLGRRSKREPA